jgi:Mn-dependent DtxR family transcriptional regulator
MKFVNKSADRWILLDKLDETVYGKNVPWLLKQFEARDDFAQELRLSDSEAKNMMKTLEENGWIRA